MTDSDRSTHLIRPDTASAAPMPSQGSADSDEDELDASPLFEYLKTPQGHEVATKFLAIFDDLKRAALTHNAGQVRLEKWLQIVIVVGVVVAATTLAVLDKFSAPVGILFGTLVGYIFGKKG